MDSLEHRFYDIEVEHLDTPDEVHLIKILSIDGRRFTYELHGPLSEEAIMYIKSMLDTAVFNDLIIESASQGFDSREAETRLKKHS